MNEKPSNETPIVTKRVLCASVLVLAACGQQAGGDYQGEPLLRMRGQAVVSALTGGQAIEPALCFFLADLPKAPAFDPSKLPAAVLAHLTIGGETTIEGPAHRHGRMATHIVDVESRGTFPAQFDVDVYQPPPSSGLSSPSLPGEPRWAAGFVCAVPADHPRVTFPFAHGGGGNADGSRYDYAIASLSTPRFYHEAYECPVGTLPQLVKSVCTKTSSGDPSLAFEFPSEQEYRSESVLGTSLGFEVVYLDKAALPGSYTAWKWGAANGLSAGYHLIQTIPLVPGVPPDDVECMAAAFTAAEQLNSDMYGARIKQMFGDDYSYNALSAYRADGGSVLELPEDIYLGARENEARLQMVHCPLRPRTELDPRTASLSIDITSDASADLSAHLGMVTRGGPGDEERE